MAQLNQLSFADGDGDGYGYGHGYGDDKSGHLVVACTDGADLQAVVINLLVEMKP